MSSKSSAARRSTLRPASTMPPTLRPDDRSLSAHRVPAETHGVLASGAQPDEAGHVAQELVRVEVAAQALEVGPVLAQRGDACLDGAGGVGKVRRGGRRQ